MRSRKVWECLNPQLSHTKSGIVMVSDKNWVQSILIPQLKWTYTTVLTIRRDADFQVCLVAFNNTSCSTPFRTQFGVLMGKQRPKPKSGGRAFLCWMRTVTHPKRVYEEHNLWWDTSKRSWSTIAPRALFKSSFVIHSSSLPHHQTPSVPMLKRL